MATYAYRCDTCAQVDEQNRPIADRDNPAPCTSCDQPMRRLLSPPAVRFKGRGFYSTDNRTAG